MMSAWPRSLNGELLLFVVLAFVSIALLTEGLYQAWLARHGPQARKIRERLASAAGRDRAPTLVELERKDSTSAVTGLAGLFTRLPGQQAIRTLLRRAGSRLTAGALVGGSIGAGLAAAAAAYALAGMPALLCAALALIAAGGPSAWLAWHGARRMRALERQLPEAIDAITRSLRAGHAFSAGLQMAADETADPLGQELRTVADEVKFGLSMNEALRNLALRVPGSDLRFFVIAVQIQRETGGNLAEVLANLAKLIRQRMELHGRVRVLTAEGRMSAWILGVLPFAMAGLLSVVNPEFMRTLWTDPVGLKAVAAAITMMCLGMVWMRLIIRIRA